MQKCRAPKPADIFRGMQNDCYLMLYLTIKHVFEIFGGSCLFASALGCGPAVLQKYLTFSCGPAEIFDFFKCAKKVHKDYVIKMSLYNQRNLKSFV